MITKKHKKKKKNIKFNELSPPKDYNHADFISINGGVTRRNFYNYGKRSDVFGRTSKHDKWSNPYTAWEKYNTSGLSPNANYIGPVPPSNRFYNSITYNYKFGAPKNSNSKRKKIIPDNTYSSSQLLDINKKVEKSLYLNNLRNRYLANKYRKDKQITNQYVNNLSNNINLYTQISPQFFYKSPTKYTRDYFGSTLNQGAKACNWREKEYLNTLVSSQYWIPKSKLPNAQGYGMKVFNGLDKKELIKDWWKYYPTLPYDYYNKSFL